MMKTKPAITALNNEDLIKLLLWKMRHQLPALVVQISPEDVEAMRQSLEYNEQTAKLNIEQRAGSTFIHLTDEKTGDQIIATENNQADLDKAQHAAKLRQIRQSIPELANQVLNQARTGDMSLSMIEDLCNGAVALAKA